MSAKQRLAVLVLAGVLRLHEGFCPKGFGRDAFFPAEWKIPTWPQDLPLEEAALLKTVSLGGFRNVLLNEEYLEGPGQDFAMQGRKTFWQASGKYFMYFCQRFQKWRIAEIKGFGKNKGGECFAFVTDSMPGRDILNKTLLKGFGEVQDGKWVMLEHAGVVRVGTLGDQLEEVEVPDDDDAASETANCSTNAEAEGAETAEPGDSSGGAEEEESKCPVMPVVRKAKKKVMQATKDATKWIRRLFPAYLAAPSEEDAIPDENNPLFAEVKSQGRPEAPRSEGACDPVAMVGCGFREQFYIEKQKNVTAAAREAEFVRLSNMKDVAMKPDSKEWLLARISILSKLTRKDQQEEL